MISIGVSSSPYSPIHCIFAIAQSNNNTYVIPNTTIIYTSWGQPIDDNSFVDIKGNNIEIDVAWMSIIENKLYRYACRLEENVISNKSHLLIGCALFGKICIWSNNYSSSEVILYDQGNCIDDEFDSFFNKEDYKIELVENESCNMVDLCDLFHQLLYEEYRIDSFNYIDIDELMKKYSYRYVPVMKEFANEGLVSRDSLLNPKFKYIEETLFDGTFDKLRNNRLLNIHMSAIPQKIALYWNIGKTEFIAYFWFEFDVLSVIFERFYGAHPDTKTDFIIRIDAEQKKYELALFRQGLKEPQIIPEDAYQLLVFKNKFEHYRSDNFNQERGAWIW